MKDVFDVQDEIARTIAERVKVTLESDRLGPLVKAGTKNFEAYQLYAKGRALMSKRGFGNSACSGVPTARWHSLASYMTGASQRHIESSFSP